MSERAQTVLAILGLIGILLMGYRAFTGTKPGTFPGEPWPCECECDADQVGEE